ncbi:DODA-type extradiol aromatic ring-opening family dioxygenase [Enhygromyxa salina]|nr:class III extradiol ring-cleavage dioxygenase [Enhygromyxa salina]
MTQQFDTQPTLFLGHGGGPLPLLDHAGHAELVRTWAPDLPIHAALHDRSVTTIVVISAHHESRDASVHVMADAAPGLLFDYSGFPPQSYEYTISNPGAPAVATRIVELLTGAGIPSALERGRGHDHGVFVPLMGLQVTTARPELPVVSVSLRGPVDYRAGEPQLTESHWAMGLALAPLRSEGVLLVGSGNTYHGRATPAEAAGFDTFLRSLGDTGPSALRRWAEHPAARGCHPRPEHLLPLLVCAGAASTSTQVESMPHDFMGHAASHFIFR